MIIDIYVHSSKETSYNAALQAGLTGDALDAAAYLAYEHKLSFDVDAKTGMGELVAVDDREFKEKNT